MKKIVNSMLCCLAACAVLYPMGEVSAAITSAKTYNERHVQRQLNSLIVPLEIGLVNAALALLPVDEQRKALSDMSGEQYANVIQTNQTASQHFMRRMYDSVRFDTLGLQCGQNCDNLCDSWLAIGGGQSFQRNSHGAKGYRNSDFNITLGATKPLNFCLFDSWLTVGLAANYQRDWIKFKQGGRGHADNWQGALYYMWNNECFYSFSATILGSDCIRVRRPIDINNIFSFKARSKVRITQWTSYSEIGLNYNWDCIYIQPFAGIEYAFYRRHALSEHGADSLNLHVRGKNVSATIGRFGVHLTTNLPCWDVLLAADLAWRTRFNFLQERIHGNFEDFGSRFRIKGPHQKSNGFEGSLLASKCFCDLVQTYVEFSGEVWDRYYAYNITLGANLAW